MCAAAVGRVGGDKAPAGSQSFSGSMDWINFSPPFDIFGGGPEPEGIEDGRGNRRHGAGLASRRVEAECTGCQACVAKRFGQKVFVCVFILLIIFGLRSACCTLYMRHYPDEPKVCLHLLNACVHVRAYLGLQEMRTQLDVQAEILRFSVLSSQACLTGSSNSLSFLTFLISLQPPDMSFPNWEGPVLTMQLFGLCDVSLELIVFGNRNMCAQWIFLGIRNAQGHATDLHHTISTVLPTRTGHLPRRIMSSPQHAM